MVEVTVIGRGPAGWTLATALAERGVETALVGPAPSPERPFPNNYGIWTDELDALGLSEVAGHQFPKTEVRLDAGRVHTLPRGYARVDNQRLHQHLSSRFLAAGGRVIDAAVRSVQGGGAESELELDDGTRSKSRLVVDATGASARFLGLPLPADLPAQVAYGVLAEVDAHPFALDTMRLMDFSPIEGAPDQPPSFMYLMPLSEDRLFIEETSLCARPPVAMEVLEERLQLRLRGLGLTPRRILEVERCFIPMGAPVPRHSPPVFAFGAAAGMVHPATGYSLGRSLAAASGVADAVNQAHRRGDALAPAAWGALWPPARRRAHALQRAGLEVLLALNAEQTRAFFHAFFDGPESDWRAYLSGDAAPEAVLRSMRGVFGRLPAGPRVRVITSILRMKSVRELARVVVPVMST